MSPQDVMTLGQEAIYVAVLVSAPLLLTALVVGLLISIVQAATQINEMTLSFIPKLLALFAALVITGPWMLTFYTDYMTRMLHRVAGVLT